MNHKRFFGLALVLCAFAAVLGCKSPPPAPDDPPRRPPPPLPPVEIIRETTLMPFTVSLMRQLQRGDIDVQKLQFILFGRISLEKESPTTTAGLEEGGRARINVEHIRNSITIKDRLEGVLMEAPTETRAGEIILSVCFDKDDNHRLNFLGRTDETESYFYLNYSPPDRNAPADERGTLVYGTERYKLKFAEEKAPYLLIRISRNYVEEKPNLRTASGRRIVSPPPSTRPAASATESTLMPFTISLMRQLQRGDIDVQKLQFILFGRILLETESVNLTVGLDEGGRAKIDVKNIRDSVTIKDRLEGALLSPAETRAGEIILSVCFDEDDNNRLNFSSKINEAESYFYLNYSPPDRNAPADERGTLVYGGKTYKLKFAGEKAPYLLIRISQNESDKPIPHEASGRRVGRTE